MFENNVNPAQQIFSFHRLISPILKRLALPFTAIVLIAVLAASSSSASAQSENTTNILLIGNSWLASSSESLNKLTEEIGDIQVEEVMHGGYNLSNHWNDPEQMAMIRAELDKGIYDFAAIIDFPTLVYDPEGGGFHEKHVILFDELFKSYGVQTVLVVPWTNSFTLNNQAAITAKEYAVAAKIGAKVAPVGAAFGTSQERYPEIMLKKSAEDHHPSVKGGYLRDLVIYASIMEKSPENLASQFGLNELEEQQLKEVAWETVLELNFGQNPPPGPAPTNPPPSPTQPSPPTATPTQLTGSTGTAPPATSTFPPSETPVENTLNPTSTSAPAGSGTATAIAAAPESGGSEPGQPGGENTNNPESEPDNDYSRNYRVALFLFAAGIALLALLLLAAGVLYLRRR